MHAADNRQVSPSLVSNAVAATAEVLAAQGKTSSHLVLTRVLPMSRAWSWLLWGCPARRAGSASRARSPARARPGAAERSGAALILSTAQLGNAKLA